VLKEGLLMAAFFFIREPGAAGVITFAAGARALRLQLSV
jgi:hypothetical protein